MDQSMELMDDLDDPYKMDQKDQIKLISHMMTLFYKREISEQIKRIEIIFNPQAVQQDRVSEDVGCELVRKIELILRHFQNEEENIQLKI